ncbi:RNA pyrophosphohydrolase [Fodinicurvata sediminis]|uniref:RNA pyrophosphohydrolase n=1 Tax=Fodinicurvata sediminis TaxID=1121832 RepID=UPI0003B6B8B7|nr:RNA pyrophosphohydrolase [Fodinicurvata sediminis]
MSNSNSPYDPDTDLSLTPEEIERLPYRPGVGIVLFNQDGQVFTAQRMDMVSDAWQMPQGGIDPDEDPQAALFRELEEETGVRNAELLAESRDWLSYDLPYDLVPKIWRGRFRGQQQKWYALKFLGDEGEIDIGGPHAEFSNWSWRPLPETPQLIVPFKRKLYERVADEFGHLAERIRTRGA